MKRTIAAVMALLILLLNIQAAFAAGNGVLTQLIPGAEPLESVEKNNYGTAEIALTPENWVEYFSVERNEIWQNDEIIPGMRFANLTLEYRLVLREKYRNRLVEGETGKLHLSYRYQECSGIFDVDKETGAMTDDGAYSTVRTISGEKEVSVSAPYQKESDNLLASSTILCVSDNGREFGIVYNSFEMTSVTGSISLKEAETDHSSDRADAVVRAQGVTGNVQWKLDDNGTLTIYGEGDMGSSLSGKPWEQEKDEIREVIVEKGVTSIGDHSFYHCANLHTVYLADSVTRIGSAAFFDCQQLQEITIPASVIMIEDQAFTADLSLNRISVDPANLSFSGDGLALYNRDRTELICCTSAVKGSFVVPEGVTLIRDYAFRYDRDLTAVELPGSLQKVGNSAFLDCDQLSEVLWHSTLTKWEKLSVAEGNDKLTAASLIFTELSDRPSSGVMETLLDDGELNVLAKDRSMEIILSGIDIADSYVLDQTGSKKGICEYVWAIEFSDGQNSYEIQTCYSTKTPGQDRIGTIDDMDHELMVKESENSWLYIGDAGMSHTGSSIHWSVDIPKEYSVDYAGILSFKVRISRYPALYYQETVHYVSADPDALTAYDIGKTVRLGHFEQDNIASDGEEGLDWLVLAVENNRALLLCEYGIDCRRWNESWDMKVSWKECTLRSWLNEEFLYRAFTQEERRQILRTKLTDTDTEDVIFLMSLDEVREYMDSEELRECVPTPYAIGRGAEDILSTESWWLRSQGTRNSSAAVVNWFAEEDTEGDMVSADGIAVRPCFWLDLTA